MMQNVWIKIYVAAVVVLIISVIGLIAAGEKKPVIWLILAIVSASVYVFARLKIRQERK